VLGRVYGKLNNWKDLVPIDDMILPKKYAETYWREKNKWKRWYGTSFEGLNVLDLGAGAGETARFFFRYGARKVICVEKNPFVFNYLLYNLSKEREEKRAFVYLSDQVNWFFSSEFDFCKIDIEGDEYLIDYLPNHKEYRLELHEEIYGKRKKQEIIKRFSLEEIYSKRIYAKHK
jgi:tRNA G37 N-methylase Trm5